MGCLGRTGLSERSSNAVVQSAPSIGVCCSAVQKCPLSGLSGMNGLTGPERNLFLDSIQYVNGSYTKVHRIV